MLLFAANCVTLANLKPSDEKNYPFYLSRSGIFCEQS